MSVLSLRHSWWGGLLVAGALLLGGCLGPGYAASRPAPAYKSVRLVGKVPAHAHYRYVGRVDGVAPKEAFVEAARDARVDIKSKAARLGADVVKIDRIRVPSDARKSKAPTVLLAGRAYRNLDAHPLSAARPVVRGHDATRSRPTKTSGGAHRGITYSSLAKAS